MLQPNYVDDVLEECNDVETPRDWIYWSLICTIAAAAGSDYFLVAFNGKVTYKPNIYTILMGESGLGKQFPVSLAKNLVDRSDTTRVIYGRSSIQAIVNDISKTKQRERGSTIMDSRCFIVNGELSTAIIQDPQALTILTDIYDPHTKWDNTLKGDGSGEKETLTDLATTALFGTSPSHFYDSIPQVNIEGGYIGRNLVIRAEKRYKDLDMFSDSDDATDFPYAKYVEHLVKIGQSGGRMIPNADAKEAINSFRRKWRQEQREDTVGFLNRVPDHIIKVAMCLCLADYDSYRTLVINQSHIEEAIEKVLPLAHTTRTVTAGLGEDPIAKHTRAVIDFLIKAPEHRLTRRQLLSKGYGNYDAPVLDRVLATLNEVGWIETMRKIESGSNTEVEISLRGEPLKQYNDYLESRKKKGTANE